MRNIRYVIYQGTCHDENGSCEELEIKENYSNKRAAIKEFNFLKKDIRGWTRDYIITRLEREIYNEEEGYWEEDETIDLDIRKAEKR